MRKIILSITMLLLLATQAFAAEAFDLKKTPWGQPVAETFKSFGLTMQPTDTALAIKGPELKGYQTTTSYLYDQGKLVLIGQTIGADKNPGLDAQGTRTLYDGLMADMDAAHKRVHPKVPAWKTAGGDYIVLSNEPNTAGGSIVVRHMPQATWQAHYAAKVPPVYAPALKGNDAAFEAGVRRRIEERYKATPVEPLADFEMDTTDTGGSVYAKYRMRNEPLTLALIKKDAQEVLVMMVKEMLEMGINPGKENIIVSLRVYRPEKGLTGQDMVRVYGRARYNPATDSVEWVEAGK